MKRIDLFVRIWSKIDTSGGVDACWPWRAYCDEDGYGRVRVDNTQRPAFAVVLEQATGQKARGRLACHTCDNPPCCNPTHGFWGTHAENHADRNRKGRQARGECQGSAKLTAVDVRTIRVRHRRKDRVNGTLAIARDYGVNKNTIDRIINNHGWLETN
jgi:hypothetical protein